MTDKPSGLALLREPFPPHQISKLPKPTSKNAAKGRCNECGGWHGLPAVHLDYVGHAALTDRLLDADPSWTWEPLSMNAEGLPVLDSFGGMWIRLTVLGVTRLGYGHAGDKTGGDAIKEIIGDALRNAAMRFGAALDLWHKGDLHLDEEDEPKTTKGLAPQNRPTVDPVQEILDGVNSGDASGAATYLATLDETALNAIWDKLPEKAQDALRKAWPITEAA